MTAWKVLADLVECWSALCEGASLAAFDQLNQLRDGFTLSAHIALGLQARQDDDLDLGGNARAGEWKAVLIRSVMRVMRRRWL